VVGVTLGERGYVGYSDGRLFKKPAYAVEALDTTGCGDVFHAGIVYGFLHGWEVERSFDFGAWAAAQVARRLGGRSGIPGRGEMEAQGYLG
jgi:sugar/nucleoside kinase (ribokinase family)